MNLAYSELCIMLAGIFRKYDAYDGTDKQTGPTLELFETTEEDWTPFADFATPWAKSRKPGIRIMAR